MRRFIRIFVLGLIISHAAWAFVKADFYWLDGIMSWAPSDRFFILWWIVTVGWMSWMFAFLIKPKKSDPK